MRYPVCSCASRSIQFLRSLDAEALFRGAFFGLVIWLIGMSAVSTVEASYGIVRQSGRGVLVLQATPQPRLFTYNLEAQGWETALELDASPVSACADETHFYVAYEKHLDRIHRESGERIRMEVDLAGGSIRHIETAGPYLLVNTTISSRSVVFFRRSDWVEVGSGEGAGIATSSAGHPEKSVAYFVESNRSSFDLRRLALDLETGETRMVHRRIGNGLTDRVWAYPDGTRILAKDGQVLIENDLQTAFKLSEPLTSAAFDSEGRAFLLVENTVEVYDRWYRRGGRHVFEASFKHLFWWNETLFLFRESGVAGWNVERLPVSALGVEVPQPRPEPEGLAFSVAATATDGDGVLYLLNREYLSVFRWDAVSRRYLDSLRLISAPVDMIHHAGHDALYFADADGTLTRLDLKDDDPVEINFAQAPPMIGMFATDDGLLVSPADHSAVRYFRSVGDEVEVQRGTDSPGNVDVGGRQLVHLPISRTQRHTIVLFDDPTRTASTLQGIFQGAYAGTSGDGAWFAGSLGHIYSAETFFSVRQLANPITAAFWNRSQLHTIKGLPPSGSEPPPEYTTVQHWDEGGLLLQEKVVPGRYVTGHVVGASTVLLTEVEGRMRFYHFDPHLHLNHASGWGEDRGQAMRVVAIDEHHVTLAWDLGPMEDSVVHLERFDPEEGIWEWIDTVGTVEEAYRIEGWGSGRTSDLRLASVARYQTEPLISGVEIEQTVNLRWAYANPPNELRLEERVGDDWNVVQRYTPPANPGSHAFLMGAKAPLTPLDFRLQFDDSQVSEEAVPTEVESSFELYWESPVGSFESITLEYVDWMGTKIETLATLAPHVTSYPLPPEHVAIPENRILLRTQPSESPNAYYLTSRRLIFELNWQGAPPPAQGWLVEWRAGLGFLDPRGSVVLDAETFRYAVSVPGGKLPINATVRAIGESGPMNYPHPVVSNVDSQIRWPQFRNDDVVILRKDDPMGAWSSSRVVSPNNAQIGQVIALTDVSWVPAFRIERAVRNAPYTYAALQFTSPGRPPGSGIGGGMKRPASVAEFMGIPAGEEDALGRHLAWSREDGRTYLQYPRSMAFSSSQIEVEWSMNLRDWQPMTLPRQPAVFEEGDFWWDEVGVETPVGDTLFYRFRLVE